MFKFLFVDFATVKMRELRNYFILKKLFIQTTIKIIEIVYTLNKSIILFCFRKKKIKNLYKVYFKSFIKQSENKFVSFYSKQNHFKNLKRRPITRSRYQAL